MHCHSDPGHGQRGVARVRYVRNVFYENPEQVGVLRRVGDIDGLGVRRPGSRPTVGRLVGELRDRRRRGEEDGDNDEGRSCDSEIMV